MYLRDFDGFGTDFRFEMIYFLMWDHKAQIHQCLYIPKEYTIFIKYPCY